MGRSSAASSDIHSGNWQPVKRKRKKSALRSLEEKERECVSVCVRGREREVRREV